MVDALGPVVRAICQDERSQLQNRERASERILEQVAKAGRPTAGGGGPTEPVARKRRLEEKRRPGERKERRRRPKDG